MAIFDFETITAEQALAWRAEDELRFTSFTATDLTVLFNPATATGPATLTVVGGARAVTFATTLAGPSSITWTFPNTTFADDSRLLVGTDGGDYFQPIPIPPRIAAFGGAGDDEIVVHSGVNLIQGNQGNDTLAAYDGFSTIYGGQGDDKVGISGSYQGGFVQGNKGDDTVNGGWGDDFLYGGQGNDRLYGSDGADYLNGNLGDDWIAGSGQLFGEDGADTLGGWAGGASTMHGGAGNDEIGVPAPAVAGARNLLFGDDGDDTISSYSPELDELYGGAGNDRIASLAPGSHGAYLNGGDGEDYLQGEGGFDTLVGGPGADYLVGGESSNPDLFVFNSHDGGERDVADHIFGWGAGDKIDFDRPGPDGYGEGSAPGYAEALSMARSLFAADIYTVLAVQVGSDVIVFSEGGAQGSVDAAAIVGGITLDQIGAGNII